MSESSYFAKWTPPEDWPRDQPIKVTMSIGDVRIGEVVLPDGTYGITLRWRPVAPQRYEFTAAWIENDELWPPV